MSKPHFPTWLGVAALALVSPDSLPAAPAWDTGIAPGAPELTVRNLTTGLGAFAAADFATGPGTEVLGNGHWTAANGRAVYSAAGAGLQLEATCTAEPGRIRVRGFIRNLRGNDRAVIVRYTVAPRGADARFQLEPSGETLLGPDTHLLGTVYPLAAMTGPDWGVALAIPPTAPCCFGLAGSSAGLTVEFYLGISPKPQRFPNAAPFEFELLPARPGWGFRSALAQYEGEYGEYYNAPFPGGGGYLWQENGAIDYALPLFRVQCGSHSPAFFALATDRAKRFGLLTTEDIGATVRTIRDLPEMPKDYDSALRALDAYRPAKVYPQYVYKDVAEIIRRCAVEGPDGKYRIALRDFSWSPKSVAFTVNPNPVLFHDRGWASSGSTMVEAEAAYLRTDPIDGVLVDSLGANFPACLNYRQDHFVYAQYPLTFDPHGRIALHNLTSHYELMAALRATAHQAGKFSTANGVYRYNRGPKNVEQYHGQDNGRWFIASQLDEATRECSVVLDRQQYEFGRAAMGRKLYNVANHNWQNALNVRRQYNRALPYTAFVSSDPHAGKSYLAAPDGYFRDRDTLQWFARNARRLHDAGWQPVTFATSDDPADIGCERYGAGADSYFALVNFGPHPKTISLAIDLAGLGVPPSRRNFTVVDVARDAQLDVRVAGDRCVVRMEAAPDEAHVLRLR